MLALLLKFLLLLCLPAIGLWFLSTLLAAPVAGYMPVYFKMVLSPVWFIVSFFVALLGWKKKMSFWVYFLISVLLSPLVGIVVVMVSGKKAIEKTE
ncbi:MAG TPA: hypothetical protein DCP37_03515 [Dehalococcoidia bacterium]|jgi:hypothetical protein|nr:hypothetical protein [Dehalococcoidia bacterium]